VIDPAALPQQHSPEGRRRQRNNPKGTPQSVRDTLSDAVDKALDDPSVRKRLLDLGADIPPKATRGQQPLAVLVKSEIARWTPIMMAANIKAE
jgi:putative tricarboxylic transport membrane protein